MSKLIGVAYNALTPEEITAMQAEAKRFELMEKSRPFTAEEVNRMLIAQQINTLEVDDNTALRMKDFYPSFTDIIGKTVKVGFKFSHGGKLYKTAQAEMTIVEHYVPDVGTESLYTEICETHDGSKYDPIPYSGNMSLVNGLYYTQDGTVYLCIRDTGNPVYNALSDLVGLYVEII